MTMSRTRAIGLARELHGKQKYDGEPYVDAHLIPVARLARQLAEMGVEPGVDPDLAELVGILHDSIEDTRATLTYLLNAGVPEPVASAVAVLTEIPVIGSLERVLEGRKLYIATIGNTPGIVGGLARCAKRADNLKNGDPVALSRLADVKPVRAARLRSKYEADRLEMAKWPPLESLTA